MLNVPIDFLRPEMHSPPPRKQHL